MKTERIKRLINDARHVIRFYTLRLCPANG
nr:MAG TPA: hypothetical protein [Caudoviricetes sp.]